MILLNASTYSLCTIHVMQLNKLLHYLACFFYSFYLLKIWQTLNLVQRQTAPLVHRVQTMYVPCITRKSCQRHCVCLCRLKIYLYTLSSRNYLDLTSTQRYHSHLFISLPLLFAKLSKQSFPILVIQWLSLPQS